jgi:hypothetical protein
MYIHKCCCGYCTRYEVYMQLSLSFWARYLFTTSFSSVGRRWGELSSLHSSTAHSSDRISGRVQTKSWSFQGAWMGMSQHNWIWTFDPIKKPRTKHVTQVALDGILEGNFTHRLYLKSIKLYKNPIYVFIVAELLVIRPVRVCARQRAWEVWGKSPWASLVQLLNLAVSFQFFLILIVSFGNGIGNDPPRYTRSA